MIENVNGKTLEELAADIREDAHFEMALLHFRVPPKRKYIDDHFSFSAARRLAHEDTAVDKCAKWEAQVPPLGIFSGPA